MELNKQAVFEYGIQIILTEAKRALQDDEPPEKTKKHSSCALLETSVLPPFFSHYVQERPRQSSTLNVCISDTLKQKHFW